MTSNPFFYHRSISGGLQTLARLARTSPYFVCIRVPVEKAEQVAQRQAERYPTITASHLTRTHLRKAQVPAVQMLIMPPFGMDTIDIFLLTNVVPPDSREAWQLCLDPAQPLTWYDYQLCERSQSVRKGGKGAITWRLTEEAQQRYRHRIARLITGRGKKPATGQRPYQLSDETAHKEVLLLAEHLQKYSGFSEVRKDIFQLARYSTRVWKSTRPHAPYPQWPTMPYVRFTTPRMAPLYLLSAMMEGYDTDSENQDQDPA